MQIRPKEPCEIYRFTMRNFILFLWNMDFLQISISKAICLMICKEILQRPVNVLKVDWLKFCSNSAVLALIGSLKKLAPKTNLTFLPFLQTFLSMIRVIKDYVDNILLSWKDYFAKNKLYFRNYVPFFWNACLHKIEISRYFNVKAKSS